VLDDVERRRFLEHPAGENPLPDRIGRAGFAVLDQQLNERAGFGDRLPRRGALARRQPDDRIADAPRFAGLHFEIPGFAVALVEKGDRRDALGHRRSFAFDKRNRRTNLRLWRSLGLSLGLAARHQPIAELRPTVNACPEERGDQNDDGDDSPARHASGVHAS